MKILYKLLIAIILPFLLINLFVFLTTTYFSNSYLAKTFSDKTLTDMVYLERYVKQYFHEIESSLSLLTRLTPPNPKNIQESKMIMDVYLNRLPEVHRVSAIDLTGEEWIRLNKFNTEEIDKEFLSLFYSPIYKVPMLQNKIYLGEINSIDYSDENLMDISLPIKNLETGKTSGVIWIKLSFQNIYDLLEQSLPVQGKIMLIYKGEVLVEADSSSVYQWNDSELIKKIKSLEDKTGTIEFEQNGKKTTLSFRTFNIDDKHFKLLLVQPNEIIYSLVRTLQYKNFIIIGIGILSFIIFMTGIIHMLTKPLVQLIKQMNDLSHKYVIDDTNDNIKRKYYAGDEIKLLQKAFNVMKKQLNIFHQSEEKFKNNLEKQVEDKVKQIKYQAYHDILTGLPNRRLFNDRLEVAMANAERYSQSIAVMFLDLDNFKNINDAEGHHMGDLYLKKVAERLQNCSREIDTVSRFGGDEFMILLPDIKNICDVEEVATRIVSNISEPTFIEGHELLTSVSIGITLFPQDGNEVTTLMKNADIAMYSAKEQGKNSYSIFKKAMNESILNHIALEKNIRKALARNEFLVYYQPKVDALSGTIYGVEALIRWQRGIDDIVSPADFIYIAEETNLINMLGEWVLTSVCNQAVSWQRQGYENLFIAVNISARHFQSDEFVSNLITLLHKTGMKPELLILEITENTVMSNVTESINKMMVLRELGIRISIDDFGTGYSSLSYLKQFPVDILKIDRSFVMDLKNNIADAAIINSIISLAHSMSLKVVAEGVETLEQAEILRKFKCDYLQGYFFSKPCPLEKVDELLSNNPFTKNNFNSSVK